MDERQISDFFYRHWRKILGGIIGLVIALIFIGFGFWAGFFILICITAGIFLGWLIDREGLDGFLDRFRRK